MVERADHAAEAVGPALRVVGLAEVDEALLVELLQRLLLGVGVEVAAVQDVLDAELGCGLLAPGQQRLGLLEAGGAGVALDRVGREAGVLGVGRALGLEVVDGEEERLALDLRGTVAVDRHEHLAERLAGVVEGGVVGEDLHLPLGAHLGGLEDDRVGDHVLAAVQTLRGVGLAGGDVGPGALAVLLVQRGDEGGGGLVGLLPEAGRVLDLGQAHHVGAGAGDRVDDLGLLALEVVGAPGPAQVAAAAHGGAVAVEVGVRLAAGGVLAEGGEVVQHVEGADLQVTADGVGRVLAGVLEVDAVGRGRLPRGGGVQAPLVEGVGDHDGLGEGGGGPDPDGLLGGQPAHRLGGVVLEVRGAAVVQQHLERVAALVVGGGLRAGAHDVTGLLQRLVADREGHLAEAVGAVHVGDGELLRAGQVEHVLDALALRLLGGEAAGEGRGLGGLERLIELLEALGADGDLGGVVVLGDLAGHAHRVPDRDLVGGLRGVHEHGGGALVRGEVQRAAGAAGLDDVAVQATGRVDRGDDALGDHVLPDHRALRAGALDLGDARLDRLAGLARLLGIGAAARRGRGRLAGDEVGGVLAGRGDACDGGRVRGARGGGRAGEGGRAAPADEIDDGRVVGAGRTAADEAVLGVGEGEDALAAGDGGGAGEVRLGQRLGAAGALCELDEEGAAGGDGALEGEDARRVEGAGRGGVLEGPAGEVDRLLGGVHELDEVVGEGRAGVAAAAVDLVDLQVAGDDDGGVSGGDEPGQGGDPEGEGSGGGTDPREAGAEGVAGEAR